MQAKLFYPESLVDVLCTVRSKEANKTVLAKTSIILQRVRVLAVGVDIDPLVVTRRLQDSASSKGNMMGGRVGGDSKGQGIVTLEVTPKEAAQLALAVREGAIDIVLRQPNDKSIVPPDRVQQVHHIASEQLFIDANQAKPLAPPSLPEGMGPKRKRAVRPAPMPGGPKPAGAEEPPVQILRGGSN
jgi:Flp pilus assembly protein CpaB